MDEDSIRQDRELARTAIRGLISYAEQLARQGQDDEMENRKNLYGGL